MLRRMASPAPAPIVTVTEAAVIAAIALGVYLAMRYAERRLGME